MKKILLIMVSVLSFMAATAQNNKLTVNSGFLFPSTLNATVGFEHQYSYGQAFEVFGEIGNHWQDGNRFWKGYYWGGGLLYKPRIVRFKNSMIRFRFGPQLGAWQKDFYVGAELGFEYNYVFQNEWEFTVVQKNNVTFLHGDTFRNGLLIGLKIPL